MALSRSLTTAISGLRNQQVAMDTIGNNLANVNTTAYKAERVQFATLFSQTIGAGQRPSLSQGGKNPKQIGIGMQVSSISRNFNQGALENTGIQTDIGIEGEGFLVLDKGGQQLYTRDGALELGLRSIVNDKGTIENKRVLVHKGTGLVLQGQNANSDGSIDSPSMGSLEDVQIPLGELQLGEASENAFFFGNLNADGDVAFTGTRSQSGQFFSDANTRIFAEGDSDLLSVFTGTGELLFQNGNSLEIKGEKGGRALKDTFTYGTNKDGTSLGDLALFMQRMFGLHTDNNIPSDNALNNATIPEINASNTGSNPELAHETLHDDGIADKDGVNETRSVYSTTRGMNGVANTALATITSVDLDDVGNGSIFSQSFINAMNFIVSAPSSQTPTVELDLDDDGTYETTRTITAFNAGTGAATLNAGISVTSPTGDYRMRMLSAGTGQVGDVNIANATAQLHGFDDPGAGFALSVTAKTLTVENKNLNLINVGDAIFLSGADITDGFYNIAAIDPAAGPGAANTVITLDREAGSGSASFTIGNVIQDTTLVQQINQSGGDQVYLSGDGVLEGLYQVSSVFDADGDGTNDSVRLGFPGGSFGDNAFSGILGKETNMAWELNPNKFYLNGNLGLKNEIDNIKMVSGTTTYSDFTIRANADGESTASSLVVFDTQGDSHTVNMVATRIDTNNNSGATWRWYADAPDDDSDISGETDPDIAIGSGSIIFDNDGQYVSESQDKLQLDLDNGQATQLIVDPDFSGMTQLASGDTGSDLNLKEQDGLGRGVLNDWAISDDGTVVAVYSNGLTKNLARIAVTTFRNNNGLVSVGGNLYRDDLNTGGPRANIPGQNEAGSIRGFTLESSNVDLSVEFTKMITTQRGFQANARTITTSDEFLLELVNLKR